MLHRFRLILTVVTIEMLLIAGAAHAQVGGPGGAGNAQRGSSFASLEQMGESAGPQKSAKNDEDQIKEAKRKITDADPRVRVEGLEKLRFVADSADANELLFRGLNDSDVRVRIKAIDILGARGTNDA